MYLQERTEDIGRDLNSYRIQEGTMAETTKVIFADIPIYMILM
jgi:hypothetical protein